jgi:hypothetical protein
MQSAIPLFLLVGSFIVLFSQNSSTVESDRAATSRFSKESCDNPGNVHFSREKGIKILKRTVCALTVFKKGFARSQVFLLRS